MKQATHAENVNSKRILTTDATLKKYGEIVVKLYNESCKIINIVIQLC